MAFDYETEEYTEDEGDVIVGWDGNTSAWYVAVMDGDGGNTLTDHDTYRSAMAEILNSYPHAECFHEQDGGGVVGTFEAWEEFRSGWEGEDDPMGGYDIPERFQKYMI